MTDDRVLLEAQFNPRVRTYWLLTGAMIMLVCVVTIPLIPLWFLIGHILTGRYLERMSCVLTDRAVHVNKGWLVRVEKTIPLDKITDVGLVQGPIMRYFDLEALSLETAGSSSQGALARVTGIANTRTFREAVLKQRDRFVAKEREEALAQSPAPMSAVAAGDPAAQGVLIDIRDTLRRIEQCIESSRE